jgi:hypothetical protein
MRFLGQWELLPEAGQGGQVPAGFRYSEPFWLSSGVMEWCDGMTCIGTFPFDMPEQGSSAL